MTSSISTIKQQITKDLQQLGYNQQDIAKNIIDVRKRLLWNINSNCLIYSHKHRTWYRAKIVDKFVDKQINKQWLIVKYNTNREKQIGRFCQDIKPIFAMNRNYYHPTIVRFIVNKLIKYNSTNLEQEIWNKKYTLIKPVLSSHSPTAGLQITGIRNINHSDNSGSFDWTEDSTSDLDSSDSQVWALERGFSDSSDIDEESVKSIHSMVIEFNLQKLKSVKDSIKYTVFGYIRSKMYTNNTLTFDIGYSEIPELIIWIILHYYHCYMNENYSDTFCSRIENYSNSYANLNLLFI
eukprot:7837_1